MANSSNLIVYRDKNGNPITSLKDYASTDQKNWEGEVYAYVWDTVEMDWVKMQQPVLESNGNIYLAVDGVEQLLADIKEQQTDKSQFVRITDGTTDVDVIATDGYNGLVNITPSHISTANSTTATLAGGATFTGTAEDAINFGNVIVSVKASHASATDGLKLQFSIDGTNWDNEDVYTIPAGVGKTFSAQVSARYYRVVYVNGSTQQTYFRLQTILKPYYVKPSSHRIADNVSSQDDAELVKAQIVGEMPSGTVTNINATTGGNLKISIEEQDEANTLRTTRADDAYNDAFQRLRVSNTDQRFDAEFLYDKLPLLFDEVIVGTGTATHNANERDVTLAIGGTGVASASLWQHFPNIYTAGNSQLIIETGVLNGANLTGTASVFLRTSVGGSIQEEVADQDDWNLDTASTVDWRFSQIFVMDFQSLKVGRIRFGLDRGGLIIPVHAIINDNEKTGGYWQLANGHIYFRIYNDSGNTITEIGYGDLNNAIGFRFTTTANASQTMKAICCTVKSEGGGELMELAGTNFSASRGTTSLTPVSTTALPVISLQVKPTFNSFNTKGLVIPLDFEITTDQPIYWEMRINATLTAPSWASVGASSITNYDVSASAVSGGRVIASGYASSSAVGRKSVSSKALTDKIPLGANYNGTASDTITLTAIKTGVSNATVFGSITWKEIR